MDYIPGDGVHRIYNLEYMGRNRFSKAKNVIGRVASGVTLIFIFNMVLRAFFRDRDKKIGAG
ncbi:hypothetical protein GCM10007426_25600 [Alloalcanivorax dieselolei]|nr:hypothetical protein GCM10007426_25600 [Alloalcanivorax dieselolei]